MTENFAGHPRSIGEIRADKNRCASDWSPRDALIATLRLLDEGKIKPDALVVCFREKGPDGGIDTSYQAAAADIHVSLGLLARVIHRMQE